MILPVVKLGTLALRTACKPIANRLKKEAGKHPKFRKCIIDIAQANHRFSVNMQRRIYGHATDVAIRPLNEEKAVQVAADLLGELFVFTVAGTAIIFEVQRSARSEARKEEQRKQEIQAMRQRDEDLARELELLKHKIAEMEQRMPKDEDSAVCSTSITVTIPDMNKGKLLDHSRSSYFKEMFGS